MPKSNGASPQPDETVLVIGWGLTERTPAGDETVPRCARSWTACSG